MDCDHMPIHSSHASLLNELDHMINTPLYVVRKRTLQQAELLIVNQEQEIKRLQEQLFSLQAKYNKLSNTPNAKE